MEEKEQRLKDLKAAASKLKEVPLGMKMTISRLQNELYPDDDDKDCLMCGS